MAEAYKPFTWVVECVNKFVDGYKVSNNFYSRDHKYQFYLRMYPNNSMTYLENYATLCLFRASPREDEVKVLYKLSILNQKGEKCYTKGIVRVCLFLTINGQFNKILF